MSPSSRTAEILAAYAAGHRSFVSLDLDEGIHSFENAVLVGADFTGTYMEANFRGADLKGASFRNTNIKCCDFSNCDLSGASFEGAAIDGAIFTEANLEGASFTGASEQGYVYQVGELPTRGAA